MSKFLIKGLFLDVGGVLMTNGWDGSLRRQMADRYELDFEEMQARHALLFDLFERGQISFDEYLAKVVFYKKRAFSQAEFQSQVFEAAQEFEGMIDFVKKLKQEFGLKVVVVSNEGRELALDRVQRFHLDEFVDFFVFSAFVNHRKPDPRFYRMALEMSQLLPKEVIYLDDRPFLVETAREMGIHAICHESLDKTKNELEKYL